MLKMPDALFERYKLDPAGMDAEVRKTLNLPEDRYYTVSRWPEHLAGRVFVDNSRHRTVSKYTKISKSNQEPKATP